MGTWGRRREEGVAGSKSTDHIIVLFASSGVGNGPESRMLILHNRPGITITRTNRGYDRAANLCISYEIALFITTMSQPQSIYRVQSLRFSI